MKLAPKEKNTKITSDVRAFILECFNKGQKAKDQKVNYAEIAKLIQDKFEVEDWLKVTQIKGVITGKLKELKTAGCDGLDPAQLDVDAENWLGDIMAIQHATQTHAILGKEGDWLTSHPLKVCKIQILILFLAKVLFTNRCSWQKNKNHRSNVNFVRKILLNNSYIYTSDQVMNKKPFDFLHVIQKESRTHHMSNNQRQVTAPTSARSHVIGCASADNFLTDLIVGQIM